MAAATSSRKHDFERLRLIRSTNIGPVSYIRLLRKFGSAGNALEALPQLANRGGGKAICLANAKEIEKELASIQTLGANMLFWGDEAYPALLTELHNSPPILIYRGQLSHLRTASVAIVGARNASAAARRFAQDLAKDLGATKVTVVSGLARGIDTAAHQGALNSSTIGVIAGGIDIVYPPENHDLQEKIATQGLLLSEQPPGTEPQARHFPYRNRIIAGLSRGTIVVEAAPRSGSLITARLANEAGRQVMAVPGSPLDPRSRGCNSLIREGATLIQSADDVLELIRHFDARAETALERSKNGEKNVLSTGQDEEVFDLNGSDRKAVTQLLNLTPLSIDELVRQSEMPASLVQQVLLELELAGRLDRHAGAKVSLKS